MNTHRILAVCALAVAAGCATPPAPTVSSTPASTIALIGIPAPSKFAVIIEKHAESGGSLESSLFFASKMATKSYELAAALNTQPFAPAAELTDGFAAALQRPDRAVVRVAGPQANREDFVKDYAASRVAADKYVDILPRTVGYWAESPTGAWRPWVYVDYRIVDARDGKVLGSGRIGTGPLPGGEDGVAIPFDNAARFPSFEALTENPARAAAGLRAAIKQVAQALAAKI